MNLAALVRANARLRGDKPAINSAEGAIGYAELWRQIESVAAFLHVMGIARDSRVGLALRDHPLHVIAHYAVARIGAVILPMDHRWSEAEKQSAAAAFAAQLVLTDGEPIPGVPTATLDASVLEPPAADLPDLDERDRDLLISLSSGTTGRPTGALVTHGNFFARFKAQWQAIGYGASDYFALLTPLFFGAGRSFAMSILAAGGTLRLAPPPLQPHDIVDVLNEPGITATFLPPTLLRILLPLHEPGTPPLLAGLDYLIVSGEPLHADEAAQCRASICANIYSYYASSEGGGISLLRPEEFTAHADTVGLPMPNTEVQIVDADDNELPAAVVGRLRYRGPGVATRYLDSDGGERDAGSGGWFYPGDLAERLATGHIALRGRDREVIIRAGVNIYPAEIEAVLQQHPDISEAAVVGGEDPDRGQIVLAFLVGEKTMDPAALASWCKARLAPYKIPQEFTLLDTLPKRASGKIDKQALLVRR